MGVITILVILLFTLFALSHVKIDFKTSTTEHFPSQQEILDAGKFSYGSPVLFLKKSEFKKNIEKQYPYVEVINIETVFPSSLVVHVRERQEIYAFVHNNKTYFCDNNLIVLRMQEEDEYTSNNSNAILIDGLELPEQEIEVGSKIYAQNYVDFYDALVSIDVPLNYQMEIIKQIEFSSHEDVATNKTAPMLTVSTFAGNDYYIYNSNLYLNFKAKKFIVAFSNLYSSYLGKQIEDADSTFDGQVWTKQLLQQAYIVIDNYYDVQDPNNPCYANVFIK